MSTCLSDAELIAYLKNELDDAARAAAEAHLGECPRCDDRCFREARRLDAAGGGPEPPTATGPAGDDDEAPAPPRVPGYEVVAPGLVGRGGLGAVWLMRETRTGRTVALKVLSRRAAGD